MLIIYRLRFEDSGLDEMMDENEISATAAEILSSQANATNTKDEAAEPAPVAGNGNGETMTAKAGAAEALTSTNGVVTTLNGELVEDECASDAINYQILLEKIDKMLEQLKLDA